MRYHINPLQAMLLVMYQRKVFSMQLTGTQEFSESAGASLLLELLSREVLVALTLGTNAVTPCGSPMLVLLWFCGFILPASDPVMSPTSNLFIYLQKSTVLCHDPYKHQAPVTLQKSHFYCVS